MTSPTTPDTTRFGKDTNRASVQQRAFARLGTAFQCATGSRVNVVEITFANEPHSHKRSLVVVDMATAKALRDRLDALLAQHDATPGGAPPQRPRLYQVPDRKGGTKNVTIPED